MNDEAREAMRRVRAVHSGAFARLWNARLSDRVWLVYPAWGEKPIGLAETEGKAWICAAAGLHGVSRPVDPDAHRGRIDEMLGRIGPKGALAGMLDDLRQLGGL